jgi:hypothetical protein
MKSSLSIFKKLIFSLLIIGITLLYSCLNNKTEINNDLNKQNLKGRVHRVTETLYTASEMKFGEISKIDKMQEFIYLYNERGYITENSMTNPFSSKFYKTTYKYNNSENLVEECSFIPEKDVPESRTTNIYNDKSLMKETICYGTDGTLNYRYLYKYDNKGKKLQDDAFNSEGKLLKKVIYKNDDSENLIEECSYSAEGKLRRKITYKYDEMKNQIEMCSYNNDGELYCKSSTKYFENGTISEKSTLNQGLPYDDLNEQEVTKFDEKGILIPYTNITTKQNILIPPF